MKNIIFTFCISALPLASCNNTQPAEAPDVAVQPTNEVMLNEQQATTAAIQLGTPQWREVSRTIRVSGKLDVPPQNLVSISAPLGGFVKSTDLLQGMKVKKGQTLLVMEDPQYIQLQENYLDTKSQFRFLEQEYKRQEQLAQENVTAAKTFQQTTANYHSTKAKLEALTARLKLIHLSPASIEGGSIQATVSIPSPIDGFVTKVNINRGSYVNPTDVMVEIVDTEHLHAEAEVFEKDIMHIKVGQRVLLRLANEAADREATVYLIGKEISPERTVRVHCHLVKEDPALLPGMYFSAMVETERQRLLSLPEEAFTTFEGKDYIFVAQPGRQRSYYMTAVTKGVCENGFCEVTLPKDVEQTAQVVTQGAFDLLGFLKNTEEEE